MEPTFDTTPATKTPYVEDKTSAIKQRLGQVGRSLKNIDLKERIGTHPFAAVGIAAACGAIVGFVQPAPQRGRITTALISTLGLIGYRLVRETAMRELGNYAKNYVMGRKEGQTSAMGAQSVDTGTGVRYTPAL